MHAANLLTFFWIVFALVWILAWARTKQTQKRAPLYSRLLYGVPVMLGSYLMAGDIQVAWLRPAKVLPYSPTLELLGLLLTAGGIALAIWARIYLGQNWSSAVM